MRLFFRYPFSSWPSQESPFLERRNRAQMLGRAIRPLQASPKRTPCHSSPGKGQGKGCAPPAPGKVEQAAPPVTAPGHRGCKGEKHCTQGYGPAAPNPHSLLKGVKGKLRPGKAGGRAAQDAQPCHCTHHQGVQEHLENPHISQLCRRGPPPPHRQRQNCPGPLRW